MDTHAPSSIQLDDYLPFLVNRIGPPVEAGFAGPLAKAGITLPMWRVMAVILSDGPQRLNDLSGRISVPLSTASRLASAMVASGHLSRVRSTDDGRAIRLDLTAGGRRIARQVAEEARRYEDRMTRSFTEKEEAELKRLLRKLYGDLAGAEARLPELEEETSHV